MPHTFISYVRENSVIVDRLARDLRAAGIEVWLDRNNIKPGQLWEVAINEAIEEGAFFIACFSKEFNTRHETYMQGELRLAIDRLRNIRRNRVWFIPVLLNEAQIPSHPISKHENLKDIHAVRLFDNWDEGIISILQAMKLDDPDYQRILRLINSLKYHPVDRHHALEELLRMDVALRKFGLAAAEAIPALAEALRDPDALVRRQAARVLVKIGSAAVPALIEALRDPDSDVRGQAAEALGQLGPAAVPALTEALHGPDALVRRQTAKALVRIGPAAVPALTGALCDPDRDVCRSVVRVLVRLGPAAVPALTEALRDPDSDVRGEAVKVLGKLGPAAVPALTEALRDPNHVVRWLAAEALGQLGLAAAEAIPALTEVLRDPESVVRWHAAEALGQLGPAAVPALTEALRNPDSGVRGRAAEALGRIK